MIERLRQDFPALRVLFISGHTASAVDDAGVLREGIDCLAKPFDAPQLLSMVRFALEQRSAGSNDPAGA
jgi:DNA-binding response OmpR family regulator